MLLQITLSNTGIALCVIVFILNTCFVGLLCHIVGRAKGYKEGIEYGESCYNGVAIELDKTWLNTSLWIGRVFRQFGEANSTMNYHYLLEAYTHPESSMVRTFRITEVQYKQLLIEENKLGKEYKYTARVIKPGEDEYYFQRVVGMHN